MCVKDELEEGKCSSVIRSPRVDRIVQRREGVAAKNEIEGKLVKESVKALSRTTSLNVEFNL